MENEAIKRCPFCGSVAHCTTLFYDSTRKCVQCTKCGVRTDYYNTAKEAIEIWNRRNKYA